MHRCVGVAAWCSSKSAAIVALVCGSSRLVPHSQASPGFFWFGLRSP